MPLLAVGVSHHRLDSDRLAELGAAAPGLATALMRREPEIAGVVVLSTCNRVELYLDAETFHPTVEAALAVLRAASSDDADAILAAVEVYAGQGAVEHLFSVACGLDSMVVGEPQIIGQVRGALIDADLTATPVLRRLFQGALTAAKAVSTGTDLGRRGRSIAAVALDLVAVRHASVVGRRVLVVGTGSLAAVVTTELSRRGCEAVEVYSRSGRAETFVASHPGAAIPVDGLLEALGRADVAITCSGSRDTVLTEDLLRRARAYAEKVLPIIDLSTAGEVADGAGDLPEVDLLTLDDIGASAPKARATALLAAQDIIDRAVAAYLHVEEGRTAAPAVTAIRAHVMELIAREVELANRRYPAETADAVARSLRRVSNALLHAPSVRAAELARAGDLEDYTRAMHTLFGITVEAP